MRVLISAGRSTVPRPRPLGDPPRPEDDPVDEEPMVAATGATVWRDAIAFVVLALAASWIPLGFLALTGREPFTDPLSTGLWAVGGYGPVVAALVMARVAHGRGGLRRLGRDLLRSRVGAWYAVLLLPLPVVAVAVLVTVTTGGATLEVAGATHWLLLPAIFLGGILFGGLEEVGWRGYLLPRLQDRATALVASVAIGLVWSVWHAPLFLIGSTTQASTPVLWFTLQAIALSVILTWTYNGTGGSLLLAVLFHGAVNGWYTAVVQGVAPAALDSFTAPAAVLTAAVAGWILLRYGPTDLAARPRRGWETARTGPPATSRYVNRTGERR
jgi:uncharacterized protein